VPAALTDALERSEAPDPRGELEAVLAALYDTLTHTRRTIKLIDRCMDHPELGPIWQAAGRESIRGALRRFLEPRIAVGQLREQTNTRLATRIVVETLTACAVHIHWDRAPESFEPAEARETVIDFLVRSLLP